MEVCKMSVLHFNVTFENDLALKNAFGYGDNVRFFMGEKTKCIISDDGIGFCRLDEHGQEVYSFPFRVSSVADYITLEPLNKMR